jgi:hypothetical protein
LLKVEPIRCPAPEEQTVCTLITISLDVVAIFIADQAVLTVQLDGVPAANDSAASTAAVYPNTKSNVDYHRRWMTMKMKIT